MNNTIFVKTFASAVVLLTLIPTRSMGEDPTITYSTSIIEVLNQARSTYSKTPAIAGAIIIDDKIFFAVTGERKWGGAGWQNLAAANDEFQQGSISKPITAALIAKAVEKGLISWNTTFADVFPEIMYYRTEYHGQEIKVPHLYGAVTLRQFLSHTSGMHYSPGDRVLNSDYVDIESLSERRYRYVLDAVKDRPLFPPERGVEYDGGAVIGAAMLEKITGQTYENLVHDWVFTPLSMAHTGFDPMSEATVTTGIWEHRWNGSSDPVPLSPPRDHHALRSPVGGVTSSVIDLARFARMTLGSDFYPSSIRRELQTTVGLSAFTPAWLVRMKNEAGGIELWHNGSNGSNYSMLQLWPNRKVAILAMTNYCDAKPDGSPSYSSKAVDFVMSKLESLLPSFGVPPATSPNLNSPTFKATDVSASDIYQSSPAYDARKAFDADYSTRWAANAGVTQASLEVKLNTPVDVSGAVINEGLGQPFRVTHYKLFVGQSDDMHLASQGDHIGPNLVIPFLQTYKNITVARLDMESTDGPTISEFHLKKTLGVVPVP